MIGARIREARESIGFTQDHFAELLGISKRSLINYEQEKRTPSAILIGDVAQKCNISPSWLLTGKGDKYNYGALSLEQINALAIQGDERAIKMAKSWEFMNELLSQSTDQGLTLEDIEAEACKGNPDAQKFMLSLNPMWGIDEEEYEQSLEEFQTQNSPPTTKTMHSDFINIPIYDIQASAGSGCLVEAENSKTSINFAPAYLSSLGVQSNQAAIIYVKGDSMVPTLNPEVPILIDMSVNEMQADGIYVIRIGDTLHVKRIQKQLDGSLKIISDNKVYDPYVISGHDLEQVKIIGRVVLSVLLF